MPVFAYAYLVPVPGALADTMTRLFPDLLEYDESEAPKEFRVELGGKSGLSCSRSLCQLVLRGSYMRCHQLLF